MNHILVTDAEGHPLSQCNTMRSNTMSYFLNPLTWRYIIVELFHSWEEECPERFTNSAWPNHKLRVLSHLCWLWIFSAFTASELAARTVRLHNFK